MTQASNSPHSTHQLLRYIFRNAVFMRMARTQMVPKPTMITPTSTKAPGMGYLTHIPKFGSLSRFPRALRFEQGCGELYPHMHPHVRCKKPPPNYRSEDPLAAEEHGILWLDDRDDPGEYSKELISQ